MLFTRDTCNFKKIKEYVFDRVGARLKINARFKKKHFTSKI